MQHERVRRLERTELQHAAIGESAEFLFSPGDADVLEQLDATGADFDAGVHRQCRRPFAVENIGDVLHRRRARFEFLRRHETPIHGGVHQ